MLLPALTVAAIIPLHTGLDALILLRINKEGAIETALMTDVTHRREPAPPDRL